MRSDQHDEVSPLAAMFADHSSNALRRRLAGSLVLLAALGAATATGCGKSKAPQAKKDLEELKDEKPKRPFEELRVFTEPNERATLDPRATGDHRIRTALKPGHWTGVIVQTKANLADFSGELTSEPVDSNRRRLDIERGAFRLSTARGAVLPKGQRKTFETLFFPPHVDFQTRTSRGSTWIDNALRDIRTGASVEASELITHMPSFQYYMVVLAGDAAHYGYLRQLTSVRPPMAFSSSNIDDTSYYRVLYPLPDPPVALPSEPLCWTSIAYVLWDDVLPSALSPEQQQAMVDWLHWGGGLTISGPESLDQLKGTFLAPYLPATAGAEGPLDRAKLAELHAAWSVQGDDGPTLGQREAAPWSGVELALHPDAEFLPGTAELVAERRVGRGRIVVTAFRLSEPELTAWRSCDSFFNACIFGRPPRRYDLPSDHFDFVGPAARHWLDPRLVTGVRYFARDALDPQVEDGADPANPGVPHTPTQLVGSTYPITGDAALDAGLIDQLKAESGVAAWNDMSWVASAVRGSLRDAAGITVPQRTFVSRMILLYLFVVVIANWLVFRLVGRVEWAWVAVPAIAVFWGLLVVWLAQLDIGFARSETELAVLEVQPGYNRAHLSRYTALYSSLSSSYDVHFEDPTAVAMPFAIDRPMLSGQSARGVTFTTTGERELKDFPVASNSTGMIHSEQMFDLGGELAWDTPQGAPPTVTNNTNLKLSGSAVFRRRSDSAGRLIDESAWLGDLEPGATAEVRFRAHDADVLSAERERDTLSAAEPSNRALSLRPLIDIAQQHASLGAGEVRLVAWRDAGLEGIEVRPSAKQARRATLVVAHLEFGRRPLPRPDENLRPAALPPEETF